MCSFALLACIMNRIVIISCIRTGKQPDAIIMHGMGIAAKHLLGRIPAGIFGPIKPGGWIALGLAQANRSSPEPGALRRASCPGFAHQYNPVRANPPFDAA